MPCQCGSLRSLRHRVTDLEPDRPPEATTTELDLDRGEQVVGLVLLEREVGVAGDPERRDLADLHAGDELVQVSGDDLLEGDEHQLVRELHEPGQVRRHLHPGEAILARFGVGHADREAERQVRDVGERVSGVDRERCQHREDVLVEDLGQRLLCVDVELHPRSERDALVLQRLDDLLEEQTLLLADEVNDVVADLDELLGRGPAVGCGGVDAGVDLILEPGDPHLEELVEVRREDRQELRTLEERNRLGPGEGEHPGVEVEPRQLAVDVPGGGIPELGRRRSVHARTVTPRREVLGFGHRKFIWGFQQPGGAGNRRCCRPGGRLGRRLHLWLGVVLDHPGRDDGRRGHRHGLTQSTEPGADALPERGLVGHGAETNRSSAWNAAPSAPAWSPSDASAIVGAAPA